MKLTLDVTGEATVCSDGAIVSCGEPTDPPKDPAAFDQYCRWVRCSSALLCFYGRSLPWNIFRSEYGLDLKY